MDNEKAQQPNGHRSVGYATKFDQTAEKLHGKAAKHGKGKKDDGQPAGGFDDTPVPRAPPGFDVKFTFHRALKLPMADINSMSSDPYVLATLTTDLSTRHKHDPPMRFRTPTIRRSCDPEWNSEWIVANVPGSGFALKARIYDEDPADHDDRLGNVHLHVDSLSQNFEAIREQHYKIKKRMGSKRAYLIRGCAAMFTRGLDMSGELIISVEVLGKTDTDNGGRLWTIGPCNWTQHISPMVGRLAGTKEPGKDGKAERYGFQANQMQLCGPVPAEIYHRYVEFKPFVQGMFTGTSFRGKVLHHALHHQHNRIYCYDRDTLYGSFPSPSIDMTLKFLDLVHWDKGGRIYTYVLTLDGMWRFTETGKEFGIDLLSKHTMHSDVNIYIAFSGEFFIRRLKNPHKEGSPEDQETHPPAEIGGGPPEGDPPHDPAYYSLIIDNDSGTYRPNAKMLPTLKKFMQKNLPGIKVVTLDCTGDQEKMNKWKTEQRERKKAEGKGVIAVQGDSSSISSSDEEDLDDLQRQAHGGAKMTRKEKIARKAHEPIDKIKNIRKGEQEREERETRDDMGTSS